MMETVRSSETSVLTRATRRHILEDDILHCIYSLLKTAELERRQILHEVMRLVWDHHTWQFDTGSDHAWDVRATFVTVFSDEWDSSVDIRLINNTANDKAAAGSVNILSIVASRVVFRSLYATERMEVQVPHSPPTST
jgi:hypothetical protein